MSSDWQANRSWKEIQYLHLILHSKATLPIQCHDSCSQNSPFFLIFMKHSKTNLTTPIFHLSDSSLTTNPTKNKRKRKKYEELHYKLKQYYFQFGFHTTITINTSKLKKQKKKLTSISISTESKK